MATKTAIPEPEVEVKEQAPEELIAIRLPLTREDQQDVFVRCNQRTWLIKRGETVMVPKCVVEILENSERAMLEGMKYQNKVQRD